MATTYYQSDLTKEQIEQALHAVNGVASSQNNGKVLYIDENGEIKAKSASEWTTHAVLQPGSASANGDFLPPSGVDGFSEFHVNVQGYPEPTGTIQINSNGLVNVKDYAEANVQVSGGGGVVQPLNVTANGTYNPPSGVDGYAPVVVNVQGGGLPAGYTELPYIESSGTQYIDTGISAPNGAKIVGELCFVSAIGEFDTICGSQTVGGTEPYRNAQIIRARTSNYYSVWSGSSNQGTSVPIDYGVMAKVLADNRGSWFALAVELQNTTKAYGSTVSTGRISNNLFLFALNNGGTAGFFSASRIKHLEIYDASGILIRDFYAAKRNSDNALGLYDMVSSTFFTNQGTGAFTTEGA